ncbi:hypothetical protein NSPZN2_10846 [Nitrospira defluvii]|uniref:Uncharacterized protein n=1 Tax=Nitrospira defluvii TaxID=330214 RepID=A0ABM8QL65_9BACT|nr:hypothetical protein NSPZN2_10846 [Nitrospira defluvii]
MAQYTHFDFLSPRAEVKQIASWINCKFYSFKKTGVSEEIAVSPPPLHCHYRID